MDWLNIGDVVLFCVPSDVKYATGHGVVALDEQVNIYFHILICFLFQKVKHKILHVTTQETEYLC